MSAHSSLLYYSQISNQVKQGKGDGKGISLLISNVNVTQVFRKNIETNFKNLYKGLFK